MIRSVMVSSLKDYLNKVVISGTNNNKKIKMEPNFKIFTILDFFLKKGIYGWLMFSV